MLLVRGILHMILMNCDDDSIAFQVYSVLFLQYNTYYLLYLLFYKYNPSPYFNNIQLF